MNNSFGNPNKFAIQYMLLSNPHNETGILGESWGIFKFLIEGKNICQYKIGNDTVDYKWNLLYIVEWMCENLHHILGYDPFPLPIQGESTLELIKNADEFETDEDDEMYLWYQAKSSWIFRHSWFQNRGGSFLSSAYFRRINDRIEISWNNDFYKEKGIMFIYPKGTSLISKVEFKEVIFKFLYDILSNLDRKVSNDIKNDKSYISELWKKIKLLEP
ncbi:hypothetical protein [Geosporobacter ferrireducens]|uniref:Uncharacterized protein n=1 Tax=Geosporobacter ferrireducens TaxID=1424294 RepID=A0A1D8GBP6_9FIRM|nr:hypothetical protein [Geosporobacter ferrireducens]AOT68319.1 hypothetical protein Gferi_01165 [Geosporobacter ferrireducens]